MKSLSHTSQFGNIAQRFPSTIRLNEQSGPACQLYSCSLSGSPTDSVRCAQIVEMDVEKGRNTAGILSPRFQFSLDMHLFCGFRMYYIFPVMAKQLFHNRSTTWPL